MGHRDPVPADRWLAWYRNHLRFPHAQYSSKRSESGPSERLNGVEVPRKLRKLSRRQLRLLPLRQGGMAPAQHALGDIPAKTGIADGNSVTQFRRVVRKRLVAFVQKTFD